MNFEFDPVKDAANREKHGVGLTFGARIFEDTDYLILPFARKMRRNDISPSAWWAGSYGRQYMFGGTTKCDSYR